MMNKIPKNTYFIIFISLILSSEIFVFYQNISLKREISSYQLSQNILSNLKRKEHENTVLKNLEGKYVPLLPEIEIKRERKTDNSPTSRYFLYFYFSRFDCGSCLSKEITNLNSFILQHDANVIKVLGIMDDIKGSDSKKRAEAFGIKFPVILLKNMRHKLSEMNIGHTPVFFFGDAKTKRIIYAFFPKPTDSSKERFIEKIGILLKG